LAGSLRREIDHLDAADILSWSSEVSAWRSADLPKYSDLLELMLWASRPEDLITFRVSSVQRPSLSSPRSGSSYIVNIRRHAERAGEAALPAKALRYIAISNHLNSRRWGRYLASLPPAQNFYMARAGHIPLAGIITQEDLRSPGRTPVSSSSADRFRLAYEIARRSSRNWTVEQIMTLANSLETLDESAIEALAELASDSADRTSIR
jgi:hypothetical protein